MSVWRCSECRHGLHLSACAQAVSSGPLGADGELTEHHDVSDCFVFGSSIQCDVHPGATIEKNVDGVYCYWVRCSAPRCEYGRVKYGSRWDEREMRCGACGGTGGAWEPSRADLGALA